MKSWRTTLAGLLTIAGPICAKIWPQYGNEILTATAIITGSGLIAARDNKVTSEQAGAAKQP